MHLNVSSLRQFDEVCFDFDISSEFARHYQRSLEVELSSKFKKGEVEHHITTYRVFISSHSRSALFRPHQLPCATLAIFWSIICHLGRSKFIARYSIGCKVASMNSSCEWDQDYDYDCEREYLKDSSQPSTSWRSFHRTNVNVCIAASIHSFLDAHSTFTGYLRRFEFVFGLHTLEWLAVVSWWTSQRFIFPR